MGYFRLGDGGNQVKADGTGQDVGKWNLFPYDPPESIHFLFAVLLSRCESCIAVALAALLIDSQLFRQRTITLADRYFVPELVMEVDDYELVGDELHHLRSVCRARPGDEVELFSGNGLQAHATVTSVDRKAAILRIVEFFSTPRRVWPRLTIACALPKGDRASLLVEKCTELDAIRIVPVKTQRSVVDAGPAKLDRLRRAAIEACKQSRRNYLLEIESTVAWPDFARHAPPGSWILDPSGAAMSSFSPALPVLAAVGPEGGWTDEELQLARACGWLVVRLPGNILRIETAAIALAAWHRLQTADEHG